MTGDPSHLAVPDPNPGTAVAVRRAPELLNREQVETLGLVANNMGKSGLFPDAKTGTAAFAKIVLGRSLGLGPAQAMTGLHVVKGNVQIAATTLGGFVKSSGTYDYRIIHHDDDSCVIEFGVGPAPRRKPVAERPKRTAKWVPLDDWIPWDDALGISDFSMADAVRAKLAIPIMGPSENDDEPDVVVGYKAGAHASEGWEKYPRNMLFARAMSNGVKWYCPDMFGGMPVYTEGDAFGPEAPDLTAGGDGQPVGMALGADVEKVLDRAMQLGHINLSSRATAEIALGGKSDEEITAWVDAAEATLDEWEKGEGRESGDAEIADAEVVPEGGESDGE